ncbi:hypothetical protein CC80DRAFT_224373 [Byssothecium circinans]|uniref:Uncharacterized protein n=1 Tax=Byssothecium circinans TaxID=147558 RepID=A0A6A5TGA1_9PLEO|nr:hypothetical protein CC80DRAFT_224373 [Byssothecium circinans]
MPQYRAHGPDHEVFVQSGSPIFTCSCTIDIGEGKCKLLQERLYCHAQKLPKAHNTLTQTKGGEEPKYAGSGWCSEVDFHSSPVVHPSHPRHTSHYSSSRRQKMTRSV